MEILESRESEYIKSKLVFTEPWQSESTIEWNFEETPEGTKASWTTKGELPGYLFWMNQEDMEASMAPDFERGLKNLKQVAEEKAGEKPDLTAELIEVTSNPYYYIEDEVSIDEMNSEFFGERYGKITDYLGEDKENMLGMPFAVYPEWDEENNIGTVQVAIACDSDKPAEGEIKKGMTHKGKAMKCSFMGPYEKTSDGHEFLHKKIAESSYKFAGAPWEVYVTDPADEPDNSKWITEIYYPVAKKGKTTKTM
jgi:effector-binding domain-containing protein